MPDWDHIGVDWDSGKWLAVGVSDNGEFSAEVYDTIFELWEEQGKRANRILVDVPIGLCGPADEEVAGMADVGGESSRKCDRLARDVIGSRSSSVFNPPCRAVVKQAVNKEDGYELEDGIYQEMNELNREVTGKGLMRQGLNIAPGIAEVEDLILENREQRVEKILEGHPEVCFRAFADEALKFSKRTAPGFTERLRLLKSQPEYTAEVFTNLAEELGEDGHTTGIDDLVDALALVITACGDELHTIPNNPAKDAEGLRMQMYYRRPEQFDDSELGII